MKKALFIGTLSMATLATAAAFACGGGKGGPGAHADTNGDGKVTLAESQAAAKTRFDNLDKNKNGAITKDELQGGRGEKLFEKADANNDGKVTLAEMQTKAKAHFEKRDANRDNVLTQDEMGHRGRGHGKKDQSRS
ncbi:MAG TPA: EF-hand domain-containing protein [Polyangiaceae bacterium]